MENAERTHIDGRRRLHRVNASARRLATDEPHGLVIDKVIEGADCIATATHTGNHGVREAPLFPLHLFLNLLRDNCLEVAHHGWERMRSHAGADAVMRVLNPRGPLAHGLGDRVLQGSGSGLHGHNLGAEQAHAVHIERLAHRILFAHVDDALHV